MTYPHYPQIRFIYFLLSMNDDVRERIYERLKQ